LFFNISTIQQAAALPLRAVDGELRVLLVTARSDGRWLLPKGWIEDGETPARSAAREAFEEAGVTGMLDPRPVGAFRYAKSMPQGYAVRSHVTVFPLAVHEELDDWPEEAERTREWFALDGARDAVGDRGLARLLKRFHRREADSLRLVVENLASA